MKYKRTVLFTLVTAFLILVVGSGWWDKQVDMMDAGEEKAQATGFATAICIDKVEYLRLGHLNKGYMSAHFRPDGTVVTCDESDYKKIYTIKQG